MNTRLKQFLAAENITQAQFADKLNVVRASVSHILSGRNNPSFDFIKAMMSNYPNLNMDWLMFGKGKMYKDSQQVLDSDQLFPIEPTEPVADVVEPLKSPDIPSVPDEKKSTPPTSNINTLIQQAQHIVNQRKVTKVIIMFNDGSFQEL